MSGCAPKCPEHLSGPPATLWADTVATFDLETHQLVLLEAGCDAYSRYLEARATVLAEGTYVTDRFGQLRAHPAVGIEERARVAMQRAIRELGLDVPVADTRPPRRGGQKW